MKLHLIDTDVFIRANRQHYGLDYCPAFWDWLAFHGQADNVASVVAVLEEIRYPIELKQWARGPGRQLFRAVDTDVLAAAKDVSLWVHGAGYLAGAVTSFMSKADYWIDVFAGVVRQNELTVYCSLVTADRARDLLLAAACSLWNRKAVYQAGANRAATDLVAGCDWDRRIKGVSQRIWLRQSCPRRCHRCRGTTAMWKHRSNGVLRFA